MKKIGKRLLAVILAAMMILTWVPAFGKTAKADDVTEVSDIETLRKLLMEEGDVSIRIKKDISGTLSYESGSTTTIVDEYGNWHTEYAPASNPVWCTVGRGNKTIDLDGNDIKVTYENWKDRYSTMFVIPEGASVTINDAENKGEIFYNGYIPGHAQYWGDYWKEAVTQNRDIFHVDGGNLTVNGGTILAGRSKNEWVTTGGHYHWSFEEPYKNALGMFEIFDGNATKYINGTAITMTSGNVTLNDGFYYGRGIKDWRLISAHANVDKWPSSTVHWGRNAVIEAQGGKLTINNGKFYAKGNADCLQIEDDVDITIRAGHFQLHHNDYVYAESKNLASFGSDKITVYDGSYGAVGFPESVYLSSETLVIYAGEDVGGTNVGDSADLVMNNSKDLGEPYFEVRPSRRNRFNLKAEAAPDVECPLLNPEVEGSLGFVSDWEQVFTYHPLADENPGWMTNYEVQVYDDHQNRLKIMNNKEKLLFTTYGESNINYFDLSQYSQLLNQFQLGQTYYLVVTITEIFPGAKTWLMYSGSACAFRITDRIDPPEILTDLSHTQVSSSGNYVTLTAKADGADKAQWIVKKTNGSVERLEPTTFNNGEATLYIKVDSLLRCTCVFSNAFGETATSEAVVDYPASFGGNITRTAYSSQGVIYLRQPGGTQGLGAEYVWYKDGVALTDQSHYRNMCETLAIKNPTTADSGTYSFVAFTDGGDIIESPTITLTVIDEEAPNYITSAVLSLDLDDLYVGDPAPTDPAIVHSDDPRFIVNSLNWKYGTYMGVITSQYAALEIELYSSAPLTYWFQYNADGDFVCMINGRRTVAHLSANATNMGVKVTLDFNNNFPIPISPVDSVQFAENTFQLVRAENVNLDLDMTVKCPSRHQTRHTIQKVELTDANKSPLPAGLSMSSSGKITGKLTETKDSVRTAVTVTTTNGDTWGEMLYFNIHLSEEEREKAEESQEQHKEQEEGKHVFTDWEYKDEEMHSRTCAECGLPENAYHCWDDGDVIQEATEEQEGIIRYTCTVCGYSVEEYFEYEEDVEGLDPYNPFTDVRTGAYYYDAVRWAVENGITTGTSATTFEPKKSVQRKEVVTFLWRAFGQPEVTGVENPFKDVSSKKYYYKAVLWAVDHQITTGTSPTTFDPNGSCSRAQVVTFLWRAFGCQEPKTKENPFTDVKKNQYYTKAVLWAYENNITTGTSSTKFNPFGVCDRAQVVTFLYRAMQLAE